MEIGESRAVQRLHESPAEDADGDHHEPAGDHAEGEDDISQRHVQSVLCKPAIRGVESALVARDLLVCLLGVDLVDGLRGNGGAVQVDDMQRSSGTRCLSLRLGNLEAPNRGRSGRPNGTEELFLLTVQVAKVG